jgi:hypothetical protein
MISYMLMYRCWFTLSCADSRSGSRPQLPVVFGRLSALHLVHQSRELQVQCPQVVPSALEL